MITIVLSFILSLANPTVLGPGLEPPVAESAGDSLSFAGAAGQAALPSLLLGPAVAGADTAYGFVLRSEAAACAPRGIGDGQDRAGRGWTGYAPGRASEVERADRRP